jgi:hypothetical protein
MISAALDLDQQIRVVMADVDGGGRAYLPSGVAAGWDQFVNSWEHFTGQDQGPGQGWLYGTGIGDWWTAAGVSMTAINGKLAELIAWRKQIGGAGLQLSSPEPGPVTPPGYNPDPTGLGSLGKYLPWIVGGLAIVYLGPGILGMLGKGRK